MSDCRILIDTGPLVAIFSERDAHHEACVAALGSLTPPLLTCWPVLTEACWLLRQRPSTVRKLLWSCREGLFELATISGDAMDWISGFLEQYASAGPELADATLMYLAERENIGTIFTLDRRDFSIYRLPKNRALRLIPDPS